MKYINTEKAPKVVGPYSQAIVSNGFIYCSGQIGIDPETNELVAGFEEQTRQVLENLSEVLKAGNSGLEKVVKTTVYLSDIKDYVTMNKIYGEYFSEHKPARAAFAVAHLPKDALIEMEVLAEVTK